MSIAGVNRSEADWQEVIKEKQKNMVLPAGAKIAGIFGLLGMMALCFTVAGTITDASFVHNITIVGATFGAAAAASMITGIMIRVFGKKLYENENFYLGLRPLSPQEVNNQIYNLDGLYFNVDIEVLVNDRYISSEVGAVIVEIKKDIAIYEKKYGNISERVHLKRLSHKYVLDENSAALLQNHNQGEELWKKIKQHRVQISQMFQEGHLACPRNTNGLLLQDTT